MKSFTANAVGIIEGVFDDASTRWPALRASMDKDLSYLRRAVEQRGVSFLTITLPAYCKVIERSLDNGSLSLNEIPQGIPKRRDRALFLGGLIDKVFDDLNLLRPDACPDAVFFIRQILLCNKKMRLECKASATRNSFIEFYEIEKHLVPPVAGTWEVDNPIWRPRFGHPLTGEPTSHELKDEISQACDDTRGSPFDWDQFWQLCRYCTSVIGEPDWWSIRPKHGPGAVAERRGEFVSKYEFPNWSQRLESMFPFDWHGSGALVPDSYPSSSEICSRLSAVPKDHRGPRLICSEPLSNQWIQQGIAQWLERRFQTTLIGKVIDLHDQERSRKAVLAASTRGISTFATIDLSSASDRISARLVEYVFQGSEILDGLHACRTRFMSQSYSDEFPKVLALKKFSTMGSALTFPVQSLIFAIISICALRVVEGTADSLADLDESFERVLVYGDDIIIPVEAYKVVQILLRECGLKVNSQKSFGGVAFRESCGMDAFDGVDVTPAYHLKPYDDSPSSIASIVEQCNNFFIRGCWNASQVILSSIPIAEQKLLRICGEEDGNFGLRSFLGSKTSHLRQGWDVDLQRSYSISLALDVKVEKERGRGSADLIQYFTERPSPLVEWAAGQVSSVRERKARTRVLD